MGLWLFLALAGCKRAPATAPGDAAVDPFKAGQLVVYPGRGVMELGAVETHDGTSYRPLRDENARIMLPEKKLAEVVRAPMAAQQAEAMLARLASVEGNPDGRQWPYRHRDVMRTLVGGQADAMAERLHQLYLSPYKPSFGELKLTMTLEDALLSELVLARSPGKTFDEVRQDRAALVASLHAKFPAFSPGALPRPPEAPLEPPQPVDPFSLSNATYLGTFSVGSGKLAAGDPISVGADQAGLPGRAGFVLLEAWKGTWHAYVRFADERPATLFAFVDPAVIGAPPAAPTAKEVGRLWVDSGQMAIVDGALRASVETRDAMTFPIFSETLIFDRGCLSDSGAGDGTYPVLASTRDGKVTWLAIDFADEPDGSVNPSWQFLQEAQRKIRLNR